MAQRRDSRGRFAGGSAGGSTAKSKSKTSASSTSAAKPKRQGSAAGGRQAQVYRKERALAGRDERRGINPNARAVASSDRRLKRGIAKKRQKAGQEAVPTAKGLSVKVKGPLAGVRKAVFKTIAKFKRNRRQEDVTAPGQKLPRWAGKANKTRKGKR
jgi:hypothetical protein